ncbi:ATP-binding protein [Lysobacter sp. A378]
MPMTARSERWKRWRLPALAAAILLIVVLPMILLYSVMRGNFEAADRVNHIRNVESMIHSLTYDVRNTEAATLALAAGIDTPLVRSRLQDSTAQIPEKFAKLVQLTREDPQQQLAMGQLKSILEQRRRLADETTRSTGRDEQFTRAEEIITRYPIQSITAQILDREQERLDHHIDIAQRLRGQGYGLIWVAMIAQLALLGLLTYLSQAQSVRSLHTERALQGANARAESALQTVREPIVAIDAGQRVVMHNTAFTELYGHPETEGRKDADPALANAEVFHGRPLAEIGGGAWQDPVFLQRLTDVLKRNRELWDYEQRQRTSDGSDRVMLINARRMPLPDSEDRVVLITVSDITARKATENHIRELNSQLEGKIEQVSEVNRELEAFSYSVSHDLRAPLRHVAGFADKLGQHLGDELDDKGRHYLDVIGSSAKRMASLIDDLLVYSRLGRSALRLQAVDMQSMVSETRAMLEANTAIDAPDRQITWRIAPLPILIGDENMLRQVWLNLLGNAVKYSSGREPSVIEVDHERLQDGSHHFSVRDNGTGFDMQYAGKLFGVFQRMHKASEFPGTGIGLASVRRVITRHTGRVWADATPDVGAVFHFVLPSTLDNTPDRERNA